MSLSELANVNVRFVETADDAAEFMRWLGERRPILAIDTETTGLEWWTPDFLRLVQFGDGATGWAWDSKEWRGLSRQALTAVRDAHMPTAWHNVKFDLHALESDGLPLPDLRRAHDTKVMHHLIDNTANHSLKPISDSFWPGASGGQQLLNKTKAKNGWTWATVPTNHPHYWAYGALDTVLTARVAEKLWPLVTPFDEAYQIEMAVQMILYRAECRGMRINPDYTGRLLTAWCDEADILKEELLAYGIAKPGSNKAVTAALEIEGWEPEEWTETGLPKLDKVVLAEVIAASGVPAEIASRVLRYKRLVKWSQNYLVKFLRDRTEGDHVHASINTMAARTGRMSVTGIALQTLPRDPSIKKCVIPEDGHKLLEVDWRAQEARLFAHYSGDDGLISAFLADADIHRYTASKVYGLGQGDVSADQRQVAKAVTFAKLYGAGAAKIAATAGIPQEEVEGFLRGYDHSFPGVPRFMDTVDQLATNRMVTEGLPYVTTWGGRRLSCARDKLYALVNYLIQGSGSDVIKRTIIDLDAVGLAEYCVVPVHDSLLFSIPEEGFKEIEDAIVQTMTRHEFAVPLEVDSSGPIDSWGAK